MKIMVRFGDNDFGRLFSALAKLLLPRVVEEDRTLTPTRVAELFNAASPALYELLYWGNCPSVNIPKISAGNVFVDEVVDQKMQTWNQWGNYDAVIIDGEGVGTDETVYLV
jgi:hypothetical protein